MNSDIIVKLAVAVCVVGGFLIQFDLSGFSFVCDCGYHTKIFKTKHEAIAAHNRVAKKCMEVKE